MIRRIPLAATAATFNAIGRLPSHAPDRPTSANRRDVSAWTAPDESDAPDDSDASGAAVHDDADSGYERVDFNTIYREQRGRVESIVRSVIGPSDELEDVVQLSFIEIYRCLERFEGRSKLTTWIYRVVVNVALQHLRKRKRKRWLSLGATGEEMERMPSSRDAGRRLEDREALEQVYAAANKLSEKKRTVWVLHELQGLDPREISEIIEVPFNTVRSRLLAARKEVMDELRRRNVIAAPKGVSE